MCDINPLKDNTRRINWAHRFGPILRAYMQVFLLSASRRFISQNSCHCIFTGVEHSFLLLLACRHEIWHIRFDRRRQHRVGGANRPQLLILSNVMSISIWSWEDKKQMFGWIHLEYEFSRHFSCSRTCPDYVVLQPCPLNTQRNHGNVVSALSHLCKPGQCFCDPSNGWTVRIRTAILRCIRRLQHSTAGPLWWPRVSPTLISITRSVIAAGRYRSLRFRAIK